MKPPKYITTAWLHRHGGCESEIVRFKEIFGKKLLINKANILRLIDGSFDISWLAYRIFSSSALNMFRIEKHYAWEHYKLSDYIDKWTNYKIAVASIWMKAYKSHFAKNNKAER